MRQNFLKLNDDKTEVIVFGSNHNLKSVDANLSLKIGEHQVVISDCIRNLGVLQDRCLSMKDHIASVSKTCFMHLHNIRRIRHLLSVEATKTLVQSLVVSRLDYANALLHGANATDLSKLERVQNAAARLVAKCSYRDHITPVLCDLHWLPVGTRIRFKILMLVYKCLNGLAPQYLCDLLTLSSRLHRYSNVNLLIVPSFRTETYGRKRFDVAAALYWNELPAEVRSCDTLYVFKKKLKTHLFRQSFY